MVQYEVCLWEIGFRFGVAALRIRSFAAFELFTYRVWEDQIFGMESDLVQEPGRIYLTKSISFSCYEAATITIGLNYKFLWKFSTPHFHFHLQTLVFLYHQCSG